MSGTPITIEEFKEAMPPQVRKNVNPELMDQINSAVTDPEVLAVFRENVVGLTSVMREGKFKVNDYLHAVKFVSHHLLGDNQTTSWSKTFPQRYNDMIGRGNTRKEVGAVASRYGSSKLVVLLLGQTMMPTHIINAPLFQEALNSQATLMRDAKSEKVRQDAGAKLLDILKPPEIKKVELDIALKEDDSIKALREASIALARDMRESIERGDISAKTAAHSKIVDVTPTSVEDT